MRASSTSPRRDLIDRHGRLLWFVTFAVILALAAAFPFTYLPLLELMGSENAPGQIVKDGYVAVTGLTGLVLIFCLYTALKQRELNRMRRALSQEEGELSDVRARLSELSALFEVSTTLNLQLRLEVILEIIVRRVVSTLRAQQASVMIYNPENGLLETRASYGLESEMARTGSKKIGEGIAGWVAEHRQAVILGQKPPNEEMGRHYKKNRDITSALSLPLQVGERIVGVLNVNRISHPDEFQDHHRELLRLFSDHIGAVIDRAETIDRLGTRTRQLEADNLKLSELNRLKDIFLSTASHELKTPLTSVIGYAEILDDSQGRLGIEQTRDFVRRMRGEAERLMSLIEDILDLSRLESGKLVLRRAPRSVKEVAHAAVDTAHSLATKYKVTISEEYAEGLPLVSIDEVKARQILVNLLVNAVKFSPEGGQVMLRTLADDEGVRVEVSDQGPGIPPGETEQIFELFGQGAGERKGGIGLGLHLVKRLTELHGGQVGVATSVGHGSTFWVRFPVPRVEAGADEAGRGRRAGSREAQAGDEETPRAAA